MSRGNAWVLGATGQIGRVAVRSLVEDGWEVTAASLGGGRDAGWDGAVRRSRPTRPVPPYNGRFNTT
ncbi:hypothetical protein ACFV01_16895, partial [Streptomyces sp. NPDC059616]